MNLAVWVGDIGVIEDLIQNGAELCLADDHGYTPFHVVSMLAGEKPELACDVFDALIDAVPTWIEHTRMYDSLRAMCPNMQVKVAHRILFKAETETNQLTPLKLASIKSNDIFSRILNLDTVYKHPFQKLGARSVAMYDMTEIDPVIDPTKPSVLDLVVLAYGETLSYTRPHPVLCGILDAKTRGYQLYFVASFILHIIMMTTYNVTAYEYILPFLLRNATGAAPEDAGMKHQSRFEFHWVDWFAFGIACFYFAYFVLCMTGIRKMYKRIKAEHCNILWMFNCLQQQTVFLLPVSPIY